MVIDVNYTYCGDHCVNTHVEICYNILVSDIHAKYMSIKIIEGIIIN